MVALPLSRRSGKKLLFAGLFLWGSLGLSQPSTPTDSFSWEDSFQKLEEGKEKESAEVYEHALARWAEEGRTSFEAHFNAGLAYARLKDFSAAVPHFWEGARLSLSPFKRYLSWRALSEVEKTLSLRDGISHQTAFVFYFILPSFFIAALASLLLWMGLGFFLYKKQGPALGCLLLCGILAVSFGVQTWVGKEYGALSVVREKADLVKSPGASESLVELPPGILVSVGEAEGAYQRIVAPLEGWVSQSKLKALR